MFQRVGMEKDEPCIGVSGSGFWPKIVGSRRGVSWTKGGGGMLAQNGKCWGMASHI